MRILGIETSCDETAAAVVEKTDGQIRVLSNVVSSQIEIHKKYGGVVPEVAAREHVLDILPVINEAIEKSFENSPSPLRRGRTGGGLDAIAVTVGPGLITSLLSGVETAKALAYAWGLPVIGVNHIEGHIAANFIVGNQESANPRLVRPGRRIRNQGVIFPAIILTVSGGHTMLVLMNKLGEYKTIGQTRDDAAGEAFDKAAALLGVGYPGGPAIAAKAAESGISQPKAGPPWAENQESGKPITLPRPMINDDNFDFSFSGLKTAIRYALERDQDWKGKIPEYCAEFQQAVVDVLVHKTIKAAKKYGAKTVMLAGGVAANLELRKQLKEKASTLIPNSLFLIPDLKYTTDNAAMIAAAGIIKAENKAFTPWQGLRVDCNLNL